MLISTTHEINGHRVLRHIGMIHAITLRDCIGDEGRGVRSALQSDQKPARDPFRYFELADNARKAAVIRLEAEASILGANAVIGMRFGASAITDEFTEVYAYGTAVIVEATYRERASASVPAPIVEKYELQRPLGPPIEEKMRA